MNGSYRAGALVPLNRLTLDGNVTYLHTRDRPGFEIDARSQRYELGYNGAVELRAFPKTFIGAKAARVDVDFAKDAVFLGASLHEELTRTETSAAASFRYALTPLTTVTLDVGRKQDRFPYSPLRDSDSTQVQVDFKFDPFAILKGRAVIGYRDLQPRSAGVPGYKGSTADVDLSYLAFGATKLSVQAQRDVQYSFDIDQPYYVLTGRPPRCRSTCTGRCLPWADSACSGSPTATGPVPSSRCRTARTTSASTEAGWATGLARMSGSA